MLRKNPQDFTIPYYTFGVKTAIFRVLVTATSVKTNPPNLKIFRSYRLPLSDKENELLGFDDPKKSIIWKCARYSRSGVASKFSFFLTRILIICRIT